MTIEQLKRIQTGRRYVAPVREFPTFDQQSIFVSGQSCSVQKIFECQQQGLPIPCKSLNGEYSLESFRIDEDLSQLYSRLQDFQKDMREALLKQKQEQQQQQEEN